MLAEPDALWSRVLRSKYCEGRCDIDMFMPRNDASNAWRGILDNIDVLRRGMGMVVGNGNDTIFWRHPWATNVPLLEHVTSAPPQELICGTRVVAGKSICLVTFFLRTYSR